MCPQSVVSAARCKLCLKENHSAHTQGLFYNFFPSGNSYMFLNFAVLGCHNAVESRVGRGHRDQRCLEGRTKAGLVGCWERARWKRRRRKGCWKWWVRGEGLQQQPPWSEPNSTARGVQGSAGWGEDVFQRKELGSFPGIL